MLKKIPIQYLGMGGALEREPYGEMAGQTSVLLAITTIMLIE